MKNETFKPYSAGSDALPWIGWMEDETGEATAWVDLAGRIHRREGLATDLPSDVATRSSVWNAIRDASRVAADLPKGGPGADYWPTSPVACLLSLVLKDVGRRIGKAREPEQGRLHCVHENLEQLFGFAEHFDLGGQRSQAAADGTAELIGRHRVGGDPVKPMIGAASTPPELRYTNQDPGYVPRSDDNDPPIGDD